MSEPLTVLLVEDSDGDALLALRELRRAGFDPLHARVDSRTALEAALAERRWDVIFCDFTLPDFSGTEALAVIVASGLDIPVITVSGTIGEEAAADMMRLGAKDFVAKEHLSRLGPAVRREIADAATRRAMRRSDIEWEAAFDAVQDPIFIHDSALGIVRVNRAYAQGAGRPASELIGLPYWQVFPRLDGPLAGCAEGRCAEHGRPHQDLLMASGQTYQSRAYPLPQEPGEPARVLHVLQDVSERRRVLEVTARGERRYRKLIESSADIVVQLDRDGRVCGLSPSTSRLTGWTDEDLLRHDLALALHPADQTAFRELLDRVCQSPEEQAPVGLRLMCRDGSLRYLDVQLRNLLDDADVDALVLTGHDMSRIMAGERQVRRMNRALRTLSAADGVVTRSVDESSLLQGMCSILVDAGHYLQTWYGQMSDTAEAPIDVLFAAGPHAASTDAPDGPAADHPGLDVALRALRSGRVEVLQGQAPLLSGFGGLELVEASPPEQEQSIAAVPVFCDGTPVGVVVIVIGDHEAFGPSEVEVLRQLGGDLGFGISALRARVEVRASAVRLRRSMESTIEAIAATVERRDPYTTGHQQRVAKLVEAIGCEMKLPLAVVDGVRFGAVIHDLGKVQLPAEILAKPGRLSALEYELIKTHPAVGHDILKGIDFPWPVAQMVLQHHERFDGSGYPQGLVGEQILLEARILAVADVIEAMASNRPYRPGLGIDVALAEIERGSGTHYDPVVARACLRLFREHGYVMPT